MSQMSEHLDPSLEEGQEQVTHEANALLLKLNKSYTLLQKLNKDIESRPFSTRIHGQFDYELKKSQSIIAKLSSLLRKYHSFEFSSNLSLQFKNDHHPSSKPIDESFIIDFKDICLRIEREWRVGTKQILQFHSKYGNKNESDHYHSDNDTRYHRKRYKNKTTRSRSHSNSHSGSHSHSQSPIHSFSNPNSPLYSPQKMSQSVTLKKNKKKIPLLNIGLSQSQILKQQPFLKEAAYHQQIGGDFVPYDEEHKLNQQIRDINDDLQYLLDINKQVNDLVREQAHSVDDMESKANKAKENVEQGADTLSSIRKSPITYAVFGALGMAVLGTPIILIGVGVKAAIGSSIGLGTVGAFSGSLYANKVNDKIEEEHNKEKQERLLNDEMKTEDSNGSGSGIGKVRGFKTMPRKRSKSNDKKKSFSMSHYLYNNMEDEEEDIDTWDARN